MLAISGLGLLSVIFDTLVKELCPLIDVLQHEKRCSGAILRFFDNFTCFHLEKF